MRRATNSRQRWSTEHPTSTRYPLNACAHSTSCARSLRKPTAGTSPGDLLLNCGSNHNDRIEAIVTETAGPLPDGWPDWNYVRIRSDLYPTRTEPGDRS